MINIILADDNQFSIDSLATQLSSSMENYKIVGGALNGTELLDLLNRSRTDIVIMNPALVLADGSEACFQVNKSYPDIKLMLLVVYHSSDYIRKLIKTGAKGFLPKNVAQPELVRSVKRVMEDKAYFSKDLLNEIMISIQQRSPIPSETTSKDLTKREEDVLRFIVNEFTTPEIAEKLFISHHTVETHRKNLISKLNVRNVAGLVRYAMTYGLLTLPEPVSS